MWMAIALAILVVVLSLAAVRDVNEITLTNLIVTGVSSGYIYQRAITTETLISHSTEQSLLLAMSFFKLAIGGYIYTIVRNLEKTSVRARSRLALDAKPLRQPFFRKLFPRLLVLGTDVQFINVGIIMVLWDLNALNLLNLQFLGQTTGQAYQQAATIEQFIGTLVNPVEMLGATFMLTGIPLGLATILYNLRMQLRMLPTLLGSYITDELKIPLPNFSLGGSEDASPETLSKGLIPRKTLAITMLGLAIGTSGLLVTTPIRTVNFFGFISQQFAGQTSSTGYLSSVLLEKLAAVTDEQWLFIGLGLVVFSINVWLGHIIRALEGTREAFSKFLTSSTGTQITPVEKRLWPTRVAIPLAVVGLAAYFVNFALGLVADSAILTQASLVPASSSPGFQQAVITQGVALILARNIKFLGFGFLLAGVGFSLVSIIINLRLTALTLLNVSPRVISFCSSNGKKPDKPDSVTLPASMSLAPWRLFAVVAVGIAIGILVFFPFAFFDAFSFIRYQTLGLAGQTSSPDYASALFSERVWEHTLLPLKLTGLGIMLFGVGRSFGVIVGFVKARMAVITEFADSIVAIGEERRKETPVVRSQ